MSSATVSATGKTITIVCDDHDTKEALLDVLTFDWWWEEPNPHSRGWRWIRIARATLHGFLVGGALTAAAFLFGWMLR